MQTPVQALLGRLCRDEDGGELLEYALILGLIAVAAIAAISVFGKAIVGKFNSLAGDAAKAT